MKRHPAVIQGALTQQGSLSGSLRRDDRAELAALDHLLEAAEVLLKLLLWIRRQLGHRLADFAGRRCPVDDGVDLRLFRAKLGKYDLPARRYRPLTTRGPCNTLVGPFHLHFCVDREWVADGSTG